MESQINMTFDTWYQEFQAELLKELVPGMEKETYRQDFMDNISPADKAREEMEDWGR